MSACVCTSVCVCVCARGERVCALTTIRFLSACTLHLRIFVCISIVSCVTGVYDHVALTDDLDDDQAGNNAARLFASSRAEYDTLLQHMLQAWLVFLFIAIVMWVALRWAFGAKIASWRVHLAEQEDQWRRDLWAPIHRQEAASRRRLVHLMREG